MVQKKKIDQVQKLYDLLANNKNFAIVKIDKTKHQSLETLRKELKKNESSFKVLKNTLLEKAVTQLSLKDTMFARVRKSFFPLKETSAILLLSSDWSRGLGSFYQFAKKEATLTFKFGLIDGQTYPKEELLAIAKLPSKAELITNIIGSFKSPTSKFVYALKFNMNKLVYILKVKSKKSN